MGLIKLLVLIAVVFAALTLWRQFQAKRDSRRSATAKAKAAMPKPMVRCSQCRIHLPEDQAVRANQHWYCCAEHRDANSND